MPKKKYGTAANMLSQADGGDEPDIDLSKPLGKEADAATFGSVNLVERERVQAVALPLDDIYPDLRQPRRAIPASVRGEWSGNPADIPAMLQHWHRQASKVAPQPLDLALLLNGLGDPKSDLPAGADNMVLLDYLDLVALAASIRKEGLTNPLTAAKLSKGYLLETGERRYLAHWLLRQYIDDVKYARALVRIVDQSDVWRQASENGVRKPLNAIGMARQLALLIMDMYQGDPDVEFTPYEKLILPGEVDRRFYAQVSSGNRYRIKRNMGERVMQVTGLKSISQVQQYRALLDISDELWMEADIHNWAEGKIRAILKPPADDTSTIVDVSEDDKPTTVGLSGNKTPGNGAENNWLLGRRVYWQQDGAPMQGTIESVYRANTAPYPGAMMAQIRDGSGQYHQKETVTLDFEQRTIPTRTVPEAAPVLPPDTDEMALQATEQSLGLDDVWSNGVRFMVREVVQHITGQVVHITDFIQWQGEVYARVEVTGIDGKVYGSRCKLTELVKPAPGKSFQSMEDDEDGLPERQEEMLLAIFHQQPIVKNGATRQALEEKGMIFVHDRMDWRMSVTKKGADYLRAAGLVPDAPPALPANPVTPAGGEATVWLPPDEERLLVDAYHGKLVDPNDSTIYAVYIKLRAKGLAIMTSRSIGKIDLTAAGHRYLTLRGLVTERVADDTDEDKAHSARQPQPDGKPYSTPQNYFDGQRQWNVGDKVRGLLYKRDGVIRSFKVYPGALSPVIVVWDAESANNPSGRVPMTSNIRELILVDDQPAPAAPVDAEAQWSNERIISQGSETALMLMWINTAGQSLARPNLAGGAINRLLESTPAQIAQFIQVNGWERYLQMLQSDNEMVNAFLKEVTDAVNNLCQMLWDKAQEIDQQGKS